MQGDHLVIVGGGLAGLSAGCHARASGLEGWMPNADAFFGHVKKTLPGLSAFYMAGQWVEPGGGVRPALLSGRQAAQILCADAGKAFAVPVSVPA